MQPDTAPTLKPCPFCGGDGVKCFNKQAGREEMHWILCRTCHASPGDRAAESEAIAAWNTRATQPTACTECERLAEALEKAFPLAAKLANFAHFNEEWGRVAVGQTDVARELKAVLSDALASHTVRLIDGGEG